MGIRDLIEDTLFAKADHARAGLEDILAKVKNILTSRPKLIAVQKNFNDKNSAMRQIDQNQDGRPAMHASEARWRLAGRENRTFGDDDGGGSSEQRHDSGRSGW